MHQLETTHRVFTTNSKLTVHITLSVIIGSNDNCTNSSTYKPEFTAPEHPRGLASSPPPIYGPCSREFLDSLDFLPQGKGEKKIEKGREVLPLIAIELF